MLFAHLLLGYSCVLIFQDVQLLTPHTVLAQVVAKDRYYVYQDKKTWEQASQFCASRDMKLVEILTYQQQKDLRTYVRDYKLLPKDPTSGYWLGGRLTDGVWLWDATGKNPRTDNHFMAGWHFGKPDGKKRNDDLQECMELQYINGSKFTESLSWNDMWCDENRGFICESEDDNPSPPPE